MVLFNYTTREITAKIVYYGPGLGGKTTNLQSIYDELPPEMKGKMLSLATKSDRTLFFDFLPIDLGSIGGMKVRVQLYTVPGQVYYNSTRKLVLKGADGVVFVADSQQAMVEANRESLENLYQNLAEQNVKTEDICIALQCNKRDLASVMPVGEMDQQLNRGKWPVFEAVATQGIGVQETLREMLKLVVLSLKDKYDFSVGESVLLDELKQVGETLKGTTASTEPPDTAVPETPPVDSALTAPLAMPVESAKLDPEPDAHEPLHALSADLHSSTSDAVDEDSGPHSGDEPAGAFAEQAVPELELFELDDEFLDSGEKDQSAMFQSTIDDPYGDDSVLVIDEDEPDTSFGESGESSASAPQTTDSMVGADTAGSAAAESDDQLEIVETEEIPEAAEPEAVEADQAGTSGSDPAVVTLTIPGSSGQTGDTEVTVPLNIQLNHNGKPLDLRLSLTLRLEN